MTPCSHSSCLIRPARESDLTAMVALLQELFAIEADFRPDPTKQEGGLKLLLDSPQGHIWVADDNGRVVGMCTLQRLVSTAEGAHVGLVEDVVVAADRRGTGIGAHLLETVEAWARQQGLRRLQLLADRGNSAALRFYRQQSWAETALIALRKTPIAPDESR